MQPRFLRLLCLDKVKQLLVRQFLVPVDIELGELLHGHLPVLCLLFFRQLLKPFIIIVRALRVLMERGQQPLIQRQPLILISILICKVLLHRIDIRLVFLFRLIIPLINRLYRPHVLLESQKPITVLIMLRKEALLVLERVCVHAHALLSVQASITPIHKVLAVHVHKPLVIIPHNPPDKVVGVLRAPRLGVGPRRARQQQAERQRCGTLRRHRPGSLSKFGRSGRQSD
mmetsp:Transcript_32202/g.78994  ORF Transcript_32202/g.78994 Transcript_32202/m.78994 type:complete len:229 (+) Transcript_32202:474-1160(+)